MIIFKIILYPFKLLGIGLIYFYKFCISPLLPKMCAYYPTCSTYALQSIKSFGIIKGSLIAGKRLLRCDGNHKGGIDYIPDNPKKEFKYLI